MAVFIDIPGIGNVEAKNAASEATLREILNVLKGQRGGGAGGSLGSSVPGGSGGSGGGGLGAVGKSASLVSVGLKKMTGAVTMAAGAFVKVSETSIDVVKSMSDIGDSVENAAATFSSIPIVGKMFGAVASASTKVNDSFLKAASGGASFAGSMQQFVATASQSGMTMEKFGEFVSNNGQAMLGLGATVEEGAKRFGQVSKGLRSVSSDLYALGFSTEEINQGLANYTRNLRLTGRQGTQSNAQLIAGSKKYLKEMDMLAKVTGQSRAEKEKELEQLKVDAQFSAAMAGLNEDVAASAEKMILSLPTPELQSLAKDIISTGTVSREQNRLLASQMPGVVQQFQALHSQTQRNVKVSDQQAISALTTMKAEGKAAQLRNKSALAAVEGMEGVAVGVASAGRINTDAYKVSSEEQQRAADETDNMNKRMQEAQQELSKISNEFTMYLAESNILPVMLDAFKGLVGIIRTYVVPFFNFLATGIRTVWEFMTTDLLPVFQATGDVINTIVVPTLLTLGNYFKEVAQTVFNFGKFVWDATAPIREFVAVMSKIFVPAFTYAADFMSDVFRTVGDVAQDYLTPIFNTVGRVISSVTDLFGNDFQPTVEDVAKFMDEVFLEPFVKVANWISTNFKGPLEFVVNLFDDVRFAISSWLAKWNSFQDIVNKVRLNFDAFKLSLEKMVLWVDEATTVTMFDEEKEKEFERKREDIARREEENAQARQALDDKLAAQAADNLTKQYAEEERRAQEREARDAEIVAERQERDKKNRAWQEGTNKILFQGASATAEAFNATAEAAEAAREGSGIDYNDSLAIAGAEYNRQFGDGEVVPEVSVGPLSAATAPATAQAETARANMESEADRKAKEAERKAEEERTAAQTEQRTPTTQESAENLLANLNSKMDHLIRLQSYANSVFDKQLTTQKGLGGDLFLSASH